jgi:hypothetical protein
MNVLKILTIKKYQDSTLALADCEIAASVIHWDKLGNNIQGPPWQSGFFKLALTDRNMQVRFCLKVYVYS